MKKIKKIQKKGMSRKAQMKMIESILVMVIFFFLLVFGIAFYAGFSSKSGDKRRGESTDIKLMQTAQRVHYMPELQCTKDGTEVVADCFDMIKADAFKTFAANNSRYSKLYYNTMINITQLYPNNGIITSTMIYNNSGLKNPNLEFFYLPITLYDATENSYSFGIATIGVYY